MWCSLAHPVSLLHPSLMPSLSVSIKVRDTIIPILCLSLSPSISLAHCEWESGTQLPLFPLSLYPSFPLSILLSTSYGFRRSLWREQLLKYLLICFPQFYLFPSLLSCPPFPSAQTPEHLQHRKMSEAAERGWKSTTWNHYLAFVAPGRFTCVNKTRGARVGWRQMREQQQNSSGADWAVRQVDCWAHFDAGIRCRGLLTGNTKVLLALSLFFF